VSDAKRDSNRVTSLMGVSSTDGTTPLPILINPATGRVLISATIADNTSTQKVIVAKAGTTVGTRDKINFIEGSGVTLTMADNAASDRVDVTIAATGGGTGTVTDVSVTAANGFAGTVATSTTTPSITLTTTITGVLKGNGTAMSAATPSTDYVAPGVITTSGLTMNTARVLGRVTAAVGAIEELTTSGSGNVAFTTSPTFVTPTLGAALATSINKVAISTPATSATLTLADGSTLATSGAFSTTLTASAATNVTLPSTGTLATLAGTETLTNKRITKRLVTTTDDSTAVIDVDVTDVYQLSAISNNTTFSTTGTPTDGQSLIIRFKDAGAAKTLSWTGFTAIGITLPNTTVISKWGYVGCQYNSAAATWHAIAYALEA